MATTTILAPASAEIASSPLNRLGHLFQYRSLGDSSSESDGEYEDKLRRNRTNSSSNVQFVTLKPDLHGGIGESPGVLKVHSRKDTLSSSASTHYTSSQQPASPFDRQNRFGSADTSNSSVTWISQSERGRSRYKDSAFAPPYHANSVTEAPLLRDPWTIGQTTDEAGPGANSYVAQLGNLPIATEIPVEPSPLDRNWNALFNSPSILDAQTQKARTHLPSTPSFKRRKSASFSDIRSAVKTQGLSDSPASKRSDRTMKPIEPTASKAPAIQYSVDQAFCEPYIFTKPRLLGQNASPIHEEYLGKTEIKRRPYEEADVESVRTILRNIETSKREREAWQAQAGAIRARRRDRSRAGTQSRHHDGRSRSPDIRIKSKPLGCFPRLTRSDSDKTSKRPRHISFDKCFPKYKATQKPTDRDLRLQNRDMGVQTGDDLFSNTTSLDRRPRNVSTSAAATSRPFIPLRRRSSSMGDQPRYSAYSMTPSGNIVEYGKAVGTSTDQIQRTTSGSSVVLSRQGIYYTVPARKATPPLLNVGQSQAFDQEELNSPTILVSSSSNVAVTGRRDIGNSASSSSLVPTSNHRIDTPIPSARLDLATFGDSHLSALPDAIARPRDGFHRRNSDGSIGKSLIRQISRGSELSTTARTHVSSAGFSSENDFKDLFYHPPSPAMTLAANNVEGDDSRTSAPVKSLSPNSEQSTFPLSPIETSPDEDEDATARLPEPVLASKILYLPVGQKDGLKQMRRTTSEVSLRSRVAVREFGPQSPTLVDSEMQCNVSLVPRIDMYSHERKRPSSDDVSHHSSFLDFGASPPRYDRESCSDSRRSSSEAGHSFLEDFSPSASPELHQGESHSDGYLTMDSSQYSPRASSILVKSSDSASQYTPRESSELTGYLHPGLLPISPLPDHRPHSGAHSAVSRSSLGSGLNHFPNPVGLHEIVPEDQKSEVRSEEESSNAGTLHAKPSQNTLSSIYTFAPETMANPSESRINLLDSYEEFATPAEGLERSRSSYLTKTPRSSWLEFESPERKQRSDSPYSTKTPTNEKRHGDWNRTLSDYFGEHLSRQSPPSTQI